MDDVAEEELDPKSVVVDDPIVGEGITTLDEHGPGALAPRTIPAPKEMTHAERERHYASGHLPYDPRCDVCVCDVSDRIHLMRNPMGPIEQSLSWFETMDLSRTPAMRPMQQFEF